VTFISFRTGSVGCFSPWPSSKGRASDSCCPEPFRVGAVQCLQTGWSPPGSGLPPAAFSPLSWAGIVFPKRAYPTRLPVEGFVRALTIFFLRIGNYTAYCAADFRLVFVDSGDVKFLPPRFLCRGALLVLRLPLDRWLQDRSYPLEAQNPLFSETRT